MRKNLLIIFILMSFVSCQQRLVLRKKVVVQAPFKEVEEGEYNINIYRIKYPSKLEEKQKFYRDMNAIFKRYYLEEKKAVIMLDREYFEDFAYLKNNNILKEEEIFNKIASTLNKAEINRLREICPIDVPMYKDTVQEYLNIQIAYLMKYLGKEAEFDPDELYTEREKNKYLDDLKEERKEIVKFLDVLNIDIFVEISNPYEEKDYTGNTYWDNKDIILSESSKISDALNNYKVALYIKNLKDNDIQNLIENKSFIDNSILVIENNKYKGYVHDGKYIFFLGGNKEKREYSAYEISLQVEDIELRDLIYIDEEVVISDFTGRMKNGL